jgi:hypothetical protein
VYLIRFRYVVLLAASLLLCLLPALASSASAATFTRGFVDDVWVATYSPSQTTQQWADNVYKSGGRIAELEVDWLTYEPNAPAAGSNAANPSNPAYVNWPDLDARVETLESAGVQPLFLVTDAPDWAQANKGANPNTQGYEPNDAALRSFMDALATRYDGHYPNPADPGHSVPRVRYYQDWAEANLSVKLAPQWTRLHGAWVNTGATIYRNMLNAFYAGVKAASPSDTVVFTGLESYGDPAGTALGRVSPVTFLETVLCLNAKLQKVCSTPAHFDVLASDPYDVGSPTTAAVNADDASAPDLAKLTKVMDAAVKAKTVLPDNRKPLWVTEFGYDSNPPNPQGISLAKQARWLEQSFYVFWSEGVNDVFWYLIRDQPGHDYQTSYFSGIYFYNGTKKPSYTAYTFPLVVAADGKKSAQIWGIAPVAGRVTVEERVSGSWHKIHIFSGHAGSVFDALIPAPAGAVSFRAVEGHQTSLSWVY